MTDMQSLMKARERMNLRKQLWFKCMGKAMWATSDAKNIEAYDKALRVIANAYAVSCEEVRSMEAVA